MKTRVTYTVNVTDDQRRAIAAYNDDDPETRRLAPRAEVQDFFEALGYDNGLGVLADCGA